MHIVISNDDGVMAPGIRQLATHLATFAQVTVVAPDRQQSATSHSITLHKPLHVDPVDFGSGIAAYQVNGTPADSVKLALGALVGDQPVDLVVSGINGGANLGLDIVYSGTASAAAEAVLQGIPAIAISLTGAPYDYEASARVAGLLVQQAIANPLPEGTYLNVNVPPLPYAALQGIAITRIGIRKYRTTYERRFDPLGRSYYWQAGEVISLHNAPDTDVHAVEQGMVSVTPIHFNFTNTDLIGTLTEWKLKL